MTSIRDSVAAAYDELAGGTSSSEQEPGREARAPSSPREAIEDNARVGDRHRELRWDEEKRSTEGRREVAAAMVDEMHGRDARAVDFEKSRPHREEWAERYPGVPIGDGVKRFVAVGRDFARDPAGAADRLAGHYLQQPLRLEKVKAAPTEDDLRHAATTRGAAERAWDAVKRDTEDRESLKDATAELREIFPEWSDEQALAHLLNLDKKLEADPIGTAAALAARSGHPVTREQHEQAAESNRVARLTSDYDAGFGRVVESGLLPGIERASVQADIADILSSKDFRRSGDVGVDLQTAYAMALQMESRREWEAEHAEKAKRAAVSLKSSGPGGGSPIGRSGSTGSLRSDIAAAFDQVRGAV